MQIHLARRDVNRVVLLLVQAAASAQEKDGERNRARKERDSGSNGDESRRQFDTRKHSEIYIEDSIGAGFQRSGIRVRELATRYSRDMGRSASELLDPCAHSTRRFTPNFGIVLRNQG